MTRVRKRILLTLAVCALLPVFGANAQPIESATIEREEYAVYSATISAIYGNGGSAQFIISNPAGSLFFSGLKEKDIPFAIPAAPRVAHETLEDFLQRNKTNRWLERRLNLRTDYVIVDHGEIKTLLHNFDVRNDWKDFNQKYPGAGGFISLSRVGLNSRLDEALVFASWTCGALCGKGEFVLLSRKDKVWKIANRALYIVS
jgi:hypothetical protein